MNPYANMGCVLKMNASCEGCKMKVLEVLTAVCGTYSVTIEAETGLADNTGEVDSNVVLYALAQSGQHAELVKVKLQHPALQMMHPHSYPYNNYNVISTSFDYGYGPYDHYYGYTSATTYPIHDPYWYERKLPGINSSYFHRADLRNMSRHHHDPNSPPWISGSCYHHRGRPLS